MTLVVKSNWGCTQRGTGLDPCSARSMRNIKVARAWGLNRIGSVAGDCGDKGKKIDARKTKSTTTTDRKRDLMGGG